MTEIATIHGAVLAAARRHGHLPFQRHRAGPGADRSVRTYAQFADRVERAARGLVAAGVRPGDRVGIVAENSAEWLVADLAVLAAGAVDVPRGVRFGPDEVGQTLHHAGCTTVLLEDPDALARYGSVLPAGARQVLLTGAPPAGAGVLGWEEILARGEEPRALPEVDPAAVATLVYTSGTTGTPKGVTLLHRNVVSNLRALMEVLPVRPGDVFLSLLPTWHMYERTAEYFAAVHGGVLSYTDLKRLRQDLVEERPHYVVSVPRVWERLHGAVEDGLRRRPAPVRAVARAAVHGSLRYVASRRALGSLTAETAHRPLGPAARLRQGLGLLWWPLHALAGGLVFRRLHHATGGRLRAALSGGGSLPAHVDAFMDAAGLRLLVGYGLTETSPVVAVRRAHRNVLGTIGVPLEETGLRVVDPESGAPLGSGEVGELHVRGPQVMSGYWGEAEATAAVLCPDGWFRTGDLCSLTPQGDVVFRGRAKDTVVLLGGENVEPEPLELAALASPLIDQIVLVGQDRKDLGALVWPDRQEAALMLGCADPEGEAVRGAVRAELGRMLGPAGGFRPWERVARVALLPGELSEEDGTLTPTLKVRRNVVAERHASLIDGLWAR